MPSGPGVISDELIHDIAASIPSDKSSFLLTSETRAEGIIEHHNKTKTSGIQIVDELRMAEYEILRQHLPDVDLV